MRNICLFAILSLLLLLISGCEEKKETPIIRGEPIYIDIGPEIDVNNTEEIVEIPAEEAPQTNATADMPENKTEEKPEEAKIDLTEINCDEKETFGFISCKKLADGNAELKIKNAGRVDLNGAYIRYYDKTLKLAGERLESFEFPVWGDKNFTLEVKKYSSRKIEVFPVTQDNICINKQLVVIPNTNCG